MQPHQDVPAKQRHPSPPIMLHTADVCKTKQTSALGHLSNALRIQGLFFLCVLLTSEKMRMLLENHSFLGLDR